MREVSRREFLKFSAAAALGASMLEFDVPGALGAKTKLPPAIDLKTLAKKSQAEGGNVTVYVGSSDLGTLLPQGFQAAYPWVKPNFVVSSTGAIRTKVLTEVTAKKG